MAFEKAVSLRPKSELLVGNLGWAYQLAGRQDEATRMLVRAIELARSHLKVDPTDRAVKRRLVLYYAKSEGLPAAEEILTELRAEAPEDRDFLYTQAVVQVLRGRAGAAVKSLDLALQAGYPATLAFADPAWRQLREEDRFRALRERHHVQSSRSGDDRGK
jgi:tetratricopeptide (TPR) repeat protein